MVISIERPAPGAAHHVDPNRILESNPIVVNIEFYADTSARQSRSLFGELKMYPPSRFLSEVPRELFGFDGPAEPPRYTLSVPPQPASPRTFR